MSHWPFRFVHAADLHLEQPPFGLSEVPDHLRDRLIEAPYQAAERVVETALVEEADFLILAGDVLHPERTGPRGPLFLAEQCQRLAERGIAVYWAGGGVDSPEVWPSGVRLPENVRVFPCGRPEEHVHQREAIPLARIIGASRGQGRVVSPSEFDADPSGLFTIGIAHGLDDVELMKSRNLSYWALGGSHARQSFFTGPRTAHCPGSPQGRDPGECGPHGCTLVMVDSQGHVRLTPVATDSLRWHRERLRVDPTTTRDDLETQLAERVRVIRETEPGLDLLVTWSVGGSGPLLGRLRRGLAGELLAQLRQRFGHGSHVVWSVEMDLELENTIPAGWYEQQTICGDFLRALRHLQKNPGESLGLESLVPEPHLAGAPASAAVVADAAVRERVLLEAALLGIDLLSGEESQS